MTFASDDFRRVVEDEALLYIPGLRSVEATKRKALLKDTFDCVYKYFNAGIHTARELRRKVLKDIRAKYASIILTAIIIAVVSFIVRKILEHIFGEEE